MLTFEIGKDGDVVEIHGDTSGLGGLRDTINRILDSGERNSHEHLMSSSWGGNELTEDNQGADSRLIHHVKIYCWDKE